MRIEVPESAEGRRLDVVLAELGGMSRSAAGALVSAGAVSVDGRVERKSYVVAAGDVIEVGEAPKLVAPPPGEVEVVFEDEHVAVVDKASGVVVHTAPGLHEATLVDALLASGRKLAPAAGEDRPGIVHRLDREVSGLLVVAKTDAAYTELSRAMSHREVERHYLALVAGRPTSDRGKIDAPIARNPKHRTRMAVLPEGRPAVTWFRIMETFEGVRGSSSAPSDRLRSPGLMTVSLLDVRLETGRTHQIRVHLAAVDLPIVGDGSYGSTHELAVKLGLKRPFLHANRLSFAHPITHEGMEFMSALPPELEEALVKVRG